MLYDNVKTVGNVYDYTSAVKYSSTNNGSSYTAGSPVEFITKQQYYHHSGVNTPKYHQLLRKGELLPFTPWRQSEIIGGVVQAQHVVDHGMTQSYWQGFRPLLSFNHYIIESLEPDYLGFDPDDVDRLMKVCIQEAAARIYSQGWDALTFIGELKETLRMFRYLFTRVLKIIASGKWADAWLEGRYGWRTLAYDIQDLQKLIRNLDDSRDRFKDRTGRTLSSVIQTSPTFTDASGTRTYLSTTESSMSIRGNVIADIHPPKVLFNPVTTLWELKKLSFVLDWFISVGSWLESLSFMALETQYHAAGGYHIDVVKNCSLQDVSWASGWSGDSSFLSNVTANVTVRIPQPIPLTPYPSVKLDWLKVDDLLALAFQYAFK